MLWEIITFPFRLVWSVLGMVFGFVGNVIGFVFNLVGGVLGFVFGGLFIVLMVIGIFALIRWFVRGIRGA